MTCSPPRTPKAAAVHPLVAKVVLASPPSSMGEVVDAICVALRPARNALEGAHREVAGSCRGGFARARLGVAAEGDLRRGRAAGGQRRGDAVHPRSSSAQPARAVERRDSADQRDAPGVAPPGRWWSTIRRSRSTRTSSCGAIRAGRGRRSRGGSSRCSPAATGPPFQKGSGRLELAQAIADARQPADRARAREPGLACGISARGWSARPATSGCAATRRRIPSCSITWPASSSSSGWSIKALAPADHALEHLPAAERAAAGRAGARPGEPAAVAVQPAAARLRVDARLGAGRLRLARAGSRGPVRRRSNRPAFSSRRTLYGFIDRQNLDGVYRTFDFAVPDATSPRRFVTTVPQQALFLMNSPFLHEQARRLAESSASSRRRLEAALGPRRRSGRGVSRLYRRVLGRLPDDG